MQFLTPAELSGLHSEQRALIDFLVLARAQHFVGFEESTFSLFLREWRYLHRLPRASSALVAAAVADIGGQVSNIPHTICSIPSTLHPILYTLWLLNNTWHIFCFTRAIYVRGNISKIKW